MTEYNLADLALTLFQEAGDALFLFDPESEQLLDVNPMAQSLSGFSRKDLLRLPVTHLFRAEAQGGLQKLRSASRKTGIFHSQEGFLLRTSREGGWVPVNLTITRLHIEPRTLGLITVRDISERRRVELALRDSEQRYRTLAENSLTGIWHITVEGHTVYVNPAMLNLLELERSEQLAGMTFHPFYPPHSLEIIRREQSKRLRGEGSSYEVELLGHRGRRRSVVVCGAPLLGGEGSVQGYMGTFTDITERKHMEEALRASEAKYRSLIENLEQSIFLKDNEFRFVAANKRFCDGLGITEADILGKTDYDFYPKHLADKYRADDVLVLREGKPLEVEEQNLAIGKPRTVRVVKTPTQDDRGQPAGVLGIFWDVTRERALEMQLRQSQKMEGIGQLAGGIAHDFNNLLTAILGNVALVLAALPENDPNRELLLAADKAAGRAAELTNGLLNFARQTRLRPRSLNLNSCVEETVRILRRAIDPRITMQVRGRLDLWTVEADQTQMTQVLLNLCLNARDAMPDGGLLSLETENVTLDEHYALYHLEARPGAFVRLRVTDTGHGMTPDVRLRIFEPFFTTKGPGKGTGLGLSSVLGIIQQHGGWIDCYSEPGQGTRFDLYLSGSPQPAEVTVPHPVMEVPRGKGETILLADDEPLLRDLGRTILRQHGYEVLVAGDGVAALELFERERLRIALVVLDLTMPRLSGRDACRRMRQLDPQVRVVFASGYSAQFSPEKDGDQVLGFVAKPYRPEELALKVRQALDAPLPEVTKNGAANHHKALASAPV